VRLDDGFLDHPKVIAAGGDAMWLYVCGLVYAGRHLTDGFIADGMVGRLSDRAAARELAERLVAVGLWEHAAGGYRIHDYAEYQPTADDVRATRAANAARQATWRSRRNGASNGVTNDVSHAGRNA
jgi:predicted kinase